MANLTDVLNFRSNLTGADIKSLYEAEPNAFVDSDKSKIDSLYYIPTPNITTNYAAADKDEVRCDSSGGTFTITLPASGSVKIVDIVGADADTGFGETNKYITLVPQPGGTTILGETSLDLDVGASRLVFTLYGSDWKLIDVSAPRFVVSDWNDLNNKPNFVDSSTVSTSYDGTNVSSEIIFPVSGALFTAPLTLPNNSRINNVEHFYQTTKPTARGDSSALVIGDRWWKTDDGTEWFWNGTYWIEKQEYVVNIEILTPIMGQAGFVSTVYWSTGFFKQSNLILLTDQWFFGRFVPANTGDSWTTTLSLRAYNDGYIFNFASNTLTAPNTTTYTYKSILAVDTVVNVSNVNVSGAQFSKDAGNSGSAFVGSFGFNYRRAL